MAPSANPADTDIHVLWINAGLRCDGDSVALTAAMRMPDSLGWDWRSKAGIPIPSVPGYLAANGIEAFFDRIRSRTTAPVPA